MSAEHKKVKLENNGLVANIKIIEHDVELRTLLSIFNLDILYQTFVLKGINYRSLEFLSEDDIKDAIKNLGYRAEFRAKLLEWRKNKIADQPNITTTEKRNKEHLSNSFEHKSISGLKRSFSGCSSTNETSTLLTDELATSCPKNRRTDDLNTRNLRPITTVVNKQGVRKKRTAWSQDMLEHFIDAWEEKAPDLTGARKKVHVYAEIAAILEEGDMYLSVEDVKVRIENLKAKYRKCKDAIEKSGGSPKEWPLYDRVHQIINTSTFKITSPSISMEDSNQRSSSSTHDLGTSVVLPALCSSPSPFPSPSQSSPSPSPSPAQHSPDDVSAAQQNNNEKFFEPTRNETTDDFKERKIKIMEDMRDAQVKQTEQIQRLVDGILHFLRHK